MEFFYFRKWIKIEIELTALIATDMINLQNETQGNSLYYFLLDYALVCLLRSFGRINLKNCVFALPIYTF